MKYRMNVFLRILSITLVFSVLLSFPVFAEGTMRVAKITGFGGTVKVLKAGGEKEFAAFNGMSLSEGDRIITGEDSWAAIQIDGDKEVKIGENTQIGMSELRGSVESGDDRTGISLWAGKLWTSIKKALNIKSKYEIKTPTTVMGVRGTRFYASQEGRKTVIAVFEGKVYAITYRTKEQPDGTTLEEAIEAFIEQNQQVTLDETVESSEDIVVEEVSIESLDTFILEQMKADPEGIDPDLLENIEQIIEQRRQEEQQQQGMPAPTPTPAPQISYAPGTQQSGGSSGGSSGSSGGSGGDEGGGSEPEELEEIVITVSPLALEVGTSAQLEVTTDPAGATVTYVSNNTEIVTVDSNGIVYGVSAGPATITVTAVKEGYTAASEEVEVAVNQLVSDPDTVTAGSDFNQTFVLEIYGVGDFREDFSGEYIELGGDFAGLTVSAEVSPEHSYMANVVLTGSLVRNTGTGTIKVLAGGWTGGHDFTAHVTVDENETDGPSYLNNIDAFYCDGKIVFHIDFDTAFYAYVTIGTGQPGDFQEVLYDNVIINHEGRTAIHTITLNMVDLGYFPYDGTYSYEVSLTDENGEEDDDPEKVSGYIPAIYGVTLSFTQSGNLRVFGKAYSVQQVKITVEDSEHNVIYPQTPEWVNVNNNMFIFNIQDPRDMDLENGIYDIVITLNDQDDTDFGLVAGHIIKTGYGITLKEGRMSGPGIFLD